MTDIQLISIKEAAQFLSVHPNTIRNMIERDELTAHRFGKRIIRIDFKQLNTILNEGDNK